MGYKHGETGLSVLLGKETTPGTEAGSIARNLGGIQKFTPRTGFEEKFGKTVHSQNRTYAKAGKKIAEFDVEFFVQNFWFLYTIFGSESYLVDTPGVGYNQHTLTENNTLPSYSAELIDDDLAVSTKIFGSKGDNFSIKCPDAGEITAALTYKGMDFGKDATPQSATELSTDPWMFDHLTVWNINSVDKVDVNVDLTWNYNRAVEPRTGKGSKAARFVKEGGRTHELVIDQYQDDMDIWDLVNDKSEFPVTLNFVKSANQDQLALTFNQCRTFEPGQDRGGDDVLKEAFSIYPFAAPGDTMLSCVVIDQLTAYAV